jgi:hypothetical protein
VRSEGQWIAALHHTAQRLLERRSVVISFAEPADDALAARSTVAGFLSELEDKGFLDPAEAAAGGRGRPPRTVKEFQFRPLARRPGGRVFPIG